MKIEIIAVGNLKEKYLTMAKEEYEKRIKGFVDFSEIEIKEQQVFSNSELSINQSLNKEAELILSKISNKDYVIVLDIKGNSFSSEDFAKKIDSIFADSNSTIKFVVGSSFGLSEKVKERANLKLSFSSFTFPHQLFRVILMEQIYRALTINANKTYHK